jgi:hypothetical protein
VHSWDLNTTEHHGASMSHEFLKVCVSKLVPRESYGFSFLRNQLMLGSHDYSDPRSRTISNYPHRPPATRASNNLRLCDSDPQRSVLEAAALPLHVLHTPPIIAVSCRSHPPCLVRHQLSRSGFTTASCPFSDAKDNGVRRLVSHGSTFTSSRSPAASRLPSGLSARL